MLRQGMNLMNSRIMTIFDIRGKYMTIELVMCMFVNRGTFFAFVLNWTITKFDTKPDLQSSPESDIIHMPLVLCRKAMKPSTCKTFIVTKCSCFVMRSAMIFDFIVILINRMLG